MKLATASQMAEIDQCAISQFSIPSTALMEHAGLEIVKRLGPLEGKRIVIFSGRGKNGGDGLVVARRAISQNAGKVSVYMPAGGKLAADTLEMKNRLFEYGGTVLEVDEIGREMTEDCDKADIIVDALFGTGLSREPAGLYARMIDLINRSDGAVYAADLPSGVYSDSGEVAEHTVKADKTITFTLAKPGHFLMPPAEYCGEVSVCGIGIPDEVLSGREFAFETADEEFLERLILPRRRDTHKGSYGKVLLICGSVGFTGAAFFAAESAVRTGSGLVYLGVPEKIYPIVASKLNEAIVFPLPDDADGRLSSRSFDIVCGYLQNCDAFLIGPGLSGSPETQELSRRLVLFSKVPTIVDADGINAFCGHINLLKDKKAPIILTPHAGEFSRLTGTEAGRVCFDDAKRFAVEHDVTLLLKGHRTVTVDGTGGAYVNTTGNPGMAKGGSGDVLSGIIVSLLGQKLPAKEAAALGAYIHGKAGDYAANRFGEYSMTPTDLIHSICEVLKKFNSREW